MYHIHPSIDERLGYFHVFATVNSAAVNVGVHVSFRISFFPQIYAKERDCLVIW